MLAAVACKLKTGTDVTNGFMELGKLEDPKLNSSEIASPGSVPDVGQGG